MSRSSLFALTGWLLLVPLAPAAGPQPKAEDARRQQMARLLQQTVAGLVPKQFEDLSQWNKTVPVPDKLALPRRRKVIVVDGREGLAHGLWKRTKAWVDDPQRDVKVEVPHVKKVDAKTTRLQVVCTVAGHAESERQRWQKGLKLLGVSAQADAVVTATLECDVKVGLVPMRFPPELAVEVKVQGVKLELRDFTLKRVGLADGKLVRDVGDELKDYLADKLHKQEPKLKEFANKELVEGFKTLGLGASPEAK